MYNCSLDDYTTCFTFGQTTTTNVPHRFCFANCCPSAAPTASPILSVAPPDTTPLPLQSTPTTTVAPHPPAATGYNFQMDNLMKNISSAPPMFRGINFDENLCSSNIKGIEYIFISDSEIQEIIDEKDLTSRYETIKTIAGTQQAHRIEIASGKIHLYEVSRDTTVMATKIMESEGQPPLVIIDECSVSDWVVCVYEKQWYVAIIDEVDLAEQEVKVTFWKPNTSKSKSGTSYISENASCYIKIGQIIKKIFPSRASRRGRTINISMEEQEEIGRLFQQFQR
ncbi:N-acetylneuraminate lyase A [Folsomia candida]|uniref:N-acetylneuraminate lyase A n=1 Tax=Folsomia candida TaxID=158441 RepID=A0A226D6E1_FOLCA|nr:N-acetylneuraminate lyase A [Folsomia candida]